MKTAAVAAVPNGDARVAIVSTSAPIRVLLVPGFVVDTYSEIEKSYVELSKDMGDGVTFVWIVPELHWKHNAFARPEARDRLAEVIVAPRLREHRIPFVVANIRKYNPIANFLLFRKVFSEFKIDAVYTHFGYERFWAALFGKLFRKTVVWNEHWHSLGTRFRWIKRIFYKLFIDDFISISKFITRTLPSNSRVHTIPNAISAGHEVDSRNGDSDVLKVKLGVPRGVPVVLMVAAFRVEKQHEVALAICERILGTRNDVVFIFLGKGPSRESFLDTCRRRGWASRIIAPGYASNVDEYYAIADVCWLTSRFEPFGYVVLEAMRHGKPIVSFATGGPAEVIHHEVTGVLVKDGDIDDFAGQLLRLLENASLRKAIGERARAAVNTQFNREKWIVAVRQKLRQVIARDQEVPSGRREC